MKTLRRAEVSENRRGRDGFTLVELLVVIAIICILASLILPAVQSSRRTAYRAECLSNIRQVGMGIQNLTASTSGPMPHLVSPLQYTNTSGFQGTMAIGWPIAILPAIDNQALLDNIRNYADSNGNISANEQIWIKTYTCPESDSNRQPLGLSYVINTGFVRADIWGTNANPTTGSINWTCACPFSDPIPGNVAVELASGVSFANGSVSPGYITAGDGASNTLLLTENLQAGPWLGTVHSQIAFGIRTPVDLQSCGPPPYQYAPLYSTTHTSPPWNFLSATAPLNTNFPGSTFTDVLNNPDQWMINRAMNSAPGTAPRPSSRHIGGVNVAFCDGSARFLGENINKNVFAQLVTSAGVRHGELTLNQASY